MSFVFPIPLWTTDIWTVTLPRYQCLVYDICIYFYAYWCSTRFPCHMMFAPFNSNTMAVTSGAGTGSVWFVLLNHLHSALRFGHHCLFFCPFLWPFDLPPLITLLILSNQSYTTQSLLWSTSGEFRSIGDDFITNQICF
jgi:hypothetical protein